LVTERELETFLTVAVKKCSVPIMALKESCTDLNMKFEVKCFCEVSNSTEREIGRQYGFASLTHFTIGTEYVQAQFKA
jgi:hypothetical protein